MAPRKPGAGRKPAKSELASGLLNALNFIGVLKGPTGQQRMPYMDHVFMANGWAIGYDGVVAAGHRIDDGVNGYVHTKLLVEALENSDKNFSYSVREDGAFQIESGAYNSLVPSLDPQQCVQTYPDGNRESAYPINAEFVDALVAASKVVSDSAEFVVHASIRMNGNSVIATDGETVLAALHGSNMPVGPLIPKQYATALAKAVKLGKVVAGFGISQDSTGNFTSFTMHFVDNSWLRTNLYAAQWPDGLIDMFWGLFNGVEMADAPKGMFDAVRKVLPFADENRNILIRPGIIRTHPNRLIGSALEVAAVPFSIDVDGAMLLEVSDIVTRMGINTTNQTPAIVFEGALERKDLPPVNVRGAMTGRTPAPEEHQQAPQTASPAPAQGGWGDLKATEPTQTEKPAEEPKAEMASGGWDTYIANVSPPAEQEEPKPRDQQAVDETIYTGLTGLPAGGLNSMQDEDDEDYIILEDDEAPAFNGAAWLDSLKDQGE